MVTDDGEHRPSGEAQNSAGHPPENASGPGPSDAPKKPRHGRFSFLWYVLLLAAIGILLILIARPDLVASEPAAINDAGTESTVTDQDAVSTEPTSDTAGSISDTAVSISGTWAMYWEGSDDQAFTVTFIGSDAGTLEIHNDDTVVETAFEVWDDLVWFKFTRTFKMEAGDWPERSTFEGTLTGLHEMTGVWTRQNWDCTPDSCKYDGKWSPYDARLVRISE